MTLARHSFRPESGEEFFLDLDDASPNEKTVADFARAGQMYEPDVSGLLSAVLRDGDTVLDVGANIGFFTVMAGRLAGPSGRIVAFEPDPANIERLRRQLEINELRNVTIVERPASDRAGEVAFYINRDNSGGNALWDPALFPGNTLSQSGPAKRLVQATTLDAEMKRLRLSAPKLLKIDTEGAEQKVLEGARGLLASGDLPFVVCELHTFGLSQMGASQDSLRALMEGYGYSTFALSWRKVLPKLIPAATAIESPYILNLLFCTPDMLGSYWPAESIDPREL
jgi:FkbM family methyltransferase